MSIFPLARRTFLRGTGALLGLPLLEAMLPRKASAQSAAPVRFAAFYYPNGSPGLEWEPSGTGTGYTLSPLFDALTPFHDDINLCTNINYASDSQHPGHCSCFLSGHQPPDAPGGAALTADQVIASAIGGASPIKTLALTPPGQCPDFGPQTGIYGTNMSWVSATTPVARYTDPQQLFDLLVAGGGTVNTGDPVAQERLARKKSVLDYVGGDATRLQSKLGRADRAVMDEYLTNVRAIEAKLAQLPPPTMMMQACGMGMARPLATYDHSADLTIKMDLMALAFQCDATRVATFVLDWEGANRSYDPWISGYGGPEGFHAASHGDIPVLRLINTFMVKKFAYLLGKLKAMPEAGGTVLKNSLMMFGSGFSNYPSLHAKQSIPTVLAGNAGGAVTTGRAIRFPAGTLNRPLLLALIQKMGVQATSFAGVSTPLAL